MARSARNSTSRRALLLHLADAGHGLSLGSSQEPGDDASRARAGRLIPTAGGAGAVGRRARTAARGRFRATGHGDQQRVKRSTGPGRPTIETLNRDVWHRRLVGAGQLPASALDALMQAAFAHAHLRPPPTMAARGCREKRQGFVPSGNSGAAPCSNLNSRRGISKSNRRGDRTALAATTWAATCRCRRRPIVCAASFAGKAVPDGGGSFAT